MSINAKFDEIYNRIKKYKTIIIHMHVRPDGDCYGSAFGLMHIIKETFNDKNVYVVGQKSNYVSFIGTPDIIKDEVYKDALAIVVDTANQERVSDQRFLLAKEIIKIDHHVLIDSYGDVELVLDDRPAAAQIVLEFYNYKKDLLSINQKAVEALFTGIVTDTGSFKYRNVSAETFRQVANLLDLGLNHTKIYELLDVKYDAYLKFKGYVLNNFEKTPNGVVYIKMTNALITKYKVSHEDATSLVNELSCLKDSPVWLLIAEYDNDIVRARIRSNGIRIDLVANKYNGGGHQLASGATLGDWDTAELLLKDLDDLVKDYKKNR